MPQPSHYTAEKVAAEPRLIKRFQKIAVRQTNITVKIPLSTSTIQNFFT
jgi:hypothetical protein